jgi:hypothetical protein
MLADLGYPGEEFEQTLFEEADLLPLTPKHAGRKERTDGPTFLASESGSKPPSAACQGGLWIAFFSVPGTDSGTPSSSNSSISISVKRAFFPFDPFSTPYWGFSTGQ